MKYIKRIVIFVLFIILFYSVNIIYADDITYSDNNNGSYKKEEVFTMHYLQGENLFFNS